MGEFSVGATRQVPAPGRARAAGFSFVEVLIVTIMVALLAAIAIPSFLGTRDQATGATAQALLRTAASGMESAVVDEGGYAAIAPAALSAMEPGVVWLSAPGAEASAGEVSVTGLGAGGYTLTTTTGSGAVYTLVKDLGAAPTVTRSCGPGCSW